jgi:hypothetical protein
MLSENKVDKAATPEVSETLIYKCKYDHQLEYKPKAPGKRIQKMDCVFCKESGIHNEPMLLKEVKNDS